MYGRSTWNLEFSMSFSEIKIQSTDRKFNYAQNWKFRNVLKYRVAEYKAEYAEFPQDMPLSWIF